MFNVNATFYGDSHVSHGSSGSTRLTWLKVRRARLALTNEVKNSFKKKVSVCGDVILAIMFHCGF